MTTHDKIKGAIYGMALGDALGLGTEFMTRNEVKSYYPSGLTDFSQFIRDMHRSMHRPGQWTNDTEVIFRMLDPIIADNGEINIVKIARALHSWYLEEPDDLTTAYRIVIPSEGWTENPIVVSHRAWRSNKMLDASNETLNRALIIGLFADDKSSIEELSRILVNITHDDTRCVATTAVAAAFIHQLFFHENEPDYDDIVDICRNIDERTMQFIRIAKNGNFNDFHIDDEETLWYTRKSLGVVLWALWNCSTPEEILHLLVNAGGDTDTNASLAMMIVGMKYGYEGLPALKEKILNRERLDDLADRLTALMDKRKV